MGLWSSFKKGAKLVSGYTLGQKLLQKSKPTLKAVAPLALGFVPGAGPALAAAYAAYSRKREGQKGARAARNMFGPDPNVPLGMMLDAANLQNRFPQPTAYALPRAPMFAGDRGARLMAIAKGTDIGSRLRIGLTAKHVRRMPSKARLRGRFDRARVLHFSTKSLGSSARVGPSERLRIVRAQRATLTGARRSRGRSTRRSRRKAA